MILNTPVTVNVPGSKSITNRALLIAAMANGSSTLKGCLTSDDARYFLECLKTLGFPVAEESDGALGKNITITGFGGEIPNKKAEIYVGSAGTAARFLVAMLAFSKGEFTIHSSEQMKKRPMQPLVDTLRAAGATVECLEQEGHFPFHIIGLADKKEIPEIITVDIGKSSQFLSALLIAAGTFGKKTEIKVSGSHGLSYVDLTAEMMKDFGVSVAKRENGQVSYLLSGTERYQNRDYDIEPDMSAAAYFYALAAVLGCSVQVKGVTGHMLQGDTEFLKVLEKMGAVVMIPGSTLQTIPSEYNSYEQQSGKIEVHCSDADKESCKTEEIIVQGPADGKLHGGFTINMSTFSDQALTLAAIAPYADGPITIEGIAHIRLQECDRVHAIRENLKVIGIATDETETSVTIYPGKPGAGEIETYDDHRVAMSFALTGLRTPGITILHPECCRKTFAEYFEVLSETLKKISK